MAPLEPWEKVIINIDDYSADPHASMMGCIGCHNGQSSPEKAVAHEGLNIRPSEGAESICATCHSEIAASASESLHTSQEGYWTQINLRSNPEDADKHAALEEMFGNHCASCHTSCGDCHVSQPASVGGGLIDSHIFNATPSLTRNCTACHGSRVGNEFLGKHEDIKADVHFRQARMTCTGCHTGQEMHGQFEGAAEVDHRYDSVSPDCTTCHDLSSSASPYHTLHGEKLSCQVCHSVTYTSCDGCHVALSEETGNPFFSTEGTYFTFLIGRNTRQSEDRPYEYVPVRHIPVDPESYAFYGEDLLENFNAAPTWAYTTPHNIQLETPQNASCAACHGNNDIFLTADKVAPEELEANVDVIVESAPELQ